MARIFFSSQLWHVRPEPPLAGSTAAATGWPQQFLRAKYLFELLMRPFSHRKCDKGSASLDGIKGEYTSSSRCDRIALAEGHALVFRLRQHDVTDVYAHFLDRRWHLPLAKGPQEAK